MSYRRLLVSLILCSLCTGMSLILAIHGGPLQWINAVVITAATFATAQRMWKLPVEVPVTPPTMSMQKTVLLKLVMVAFGFATVILFFRYFRAR